jgi:hypothetical protein
MWAKEFQSLPKSSQQIKRLKDVLSELGMTGRFTMQQAKAIKEKRELAQELGGESFFFLLFVLAEDVQSFERSVLSNHARSKSKPTDVEESDPSESSSSDADEQEVPAKRKVRCFYFRNLTTLYVDSGQCAVEYYGVSGR